MRKKDHWRKLCERGIERLKVLSDVAPFVAEHAKRSNGISLPVSGTGGDGGHATDSDTVLAAVGQRLYLGPESDDVPDPHPPSIVQTPNGPQARLQERDYPGGPHEERNGLRALKHFEAVLSELDAAADYIERQAEGAALAVRAGHPIGLASYRAHADLEERRRNQETGCRICGALDHKAFGLCHAHYHQWFRSRERKTGHDRESWVIARQYDWVREEICARYDYEPLDLAGYGLEDLRRILAGAMRPRRVRQRQSA